MDSSQAADLAATSSKCETSVGKEFHHKLDHMPVG